LREWIERERPVAIGECGLDYWVEDLDRDVQAVYFDGQLQLAREYDLPLVVHARRAVDAVIAAIKRVGKLRGVIHSYAGSEEQARQLADLGFLIGIGGPVTYERANRIRRVAASVPLETFLLETDAPDQPDSTHRGQRNEPARMVLVMETIAELRGVEPAVIAEATTRNAERLFGLG
jgi:TatD DNase family protein